MKLRLRFGFQFIMISIMTMVILSACGTTAEEPDDQVDEDVPAEVVEPNDDEENESKPNDEVEPNEANDSENNAEGSNGNKEEVDKLMATGTFEGLADLHTFEMTTSDVEEGYVAFQFYDEEITAILEEIEVGQEITVTYTKNEHGQHMAEHVE